MAAEATAAIHLAATDATAPDDRVAAAGTNEQRLAGVRRRMALTDAAVLVAAFAAAQAMRTGTPALVGSESVAVGLAVVAIWMVALACFRTRNEHVIGVGQDEYRRVISAGFATGGAVAAAAYLLDVDVARGYLAIAVPLGVLLVCLARKAWRVHLARMRSRGRYLADVLLVGDVDDVRYVGRKITATPAAGYRVRAVVTDGVPPGGVVDCGGIPVPVVGGIDDLVPMARSTAVQSVVLAGAVSGHDRLRRVGWQLEEAGVELVVSSPLVDIAETRVHHRPVDGLPLMHVEAPEYDRMRLGKRVLDIVGAGVGLVLLAPLIAVVALAVRLDDGGPVFFRQTRVGRGGTPFEILKFRTMCVDAEERIAELERLDEGSGPLFKIRQDPRVTRVGCFLRRTSVDELPQLWNVLTGSMSLVGPRPALPREVALYVDFADRRLLATPGITGLWQVNGRSDLDWADGLRLDLHYVENWSFLQDLVILARTIPSVLRSRGAY